MWAIRLNHWHCRSGEVKKKEEKNVGGGAGCAGQGAEGAEERNMDSWRSWNWENRVKSIKWYYWPLKLIGEVAVKGPWKPGMHDAALAAHIKRCFPFMLHWARRRMREGGEGDSDKGSLCTFTAPMTLMTAGLISDLMTPLVLGGLN